MVNIVDPAGPDIRSMSIEELSKRVREAYDKRSKAYKAYNEAGTLAERTVRRVDYNIAQAEYNSLSREVARREAAARAVNRVRRQMALSIAGVAASDAKVVWSDDSITHVYFGGIDRADGALHGHVIIKDGAVIYRREPAASHGSHNYIS